MVLKYCLGSAIGWSLSAHLAILCIHTWLISVLGLGRPGETNSRAASRLALGTERLPLDHLTPEVCTSCYKLTEGRRQQRPRRFCGLSGKNVSLAGQGCLFPGATLGSAEPGSVRLAACPCIQFCISTPRSRPQWDHHCTPVVAN